MRRTASIFVVPLLAISLAGVAEAGERFELDNAHSYIGFNVRHMGISSVRGEFKSYSAELNVDESDLTKSSILLKIDADSIDTDNQQRDDHLRSADFLEVETYPEIVFKSEQIEKSVNGNYKATGNLTIHGITREVVLDVRVAGPVKDPYGNHRVGVEGELTLDRQDYDVKFSRLIEGGELVVADEVRISFALEAMRKLD